MQNVAPPRTPGRRATYCIVRVQTSHGRALRRTLRRFTQYVTGAPLRPAGTMILTPQGEKIGRLMVIYSAPGG